MLPVNRFAEKARFSILVHFAVCFYGVSFINHSNIMWPLTTSSEDHFPSAAVSSQMLRFHVRPLLGKRSASIVVADAGYLPDVRGRGLLRFCKR
jgi:hypothetical protein